METEFRNYKTAERERLWLRVDSGDDTDRLVFGGPDSALVLGYGGDLKLGSQVAVSYDNVREHKIAPEFANHEATGDV